LRSTAVKSELGLLLLLADVRANERSATARDQDRAPLFPFRHKTKNNQAGSSLFATVLDGLAVLFHRAFLRHSLALVPIVAIADPAAHDVYTFNRNVL
jgi:hypothetical protein